MKDRKIRTKNSAKTTVVSKDIRERLELIDKDIDLKLQTLQPLLESSLTLEDSLAMLVEGLFRPN